MPLISNAIRGGAGNCSDDCNFMQSSNGREISGRVPGTQQTWTSRPLRSGQIVSAELMVERALAGTQTRREFPSCLGVCVERRLEELPSDRRIASQYGSPSRQIAFQRRCVACATRSEPLSDSLPTSGHCAFQSEICSESPSVLMNSIRSTACSSSRTHREWPRFQECNETGINTHDGGIYISVLARERGCKRREIVGAVAQWRKFEADHVQAMVKIGSKAILPHGVGHNGSLAAPIIRTLTLVSQSEPRPRTAPRWSTSSNFGCSARGRSLTSSRSSVLPSAAWKRPSRSRIAPENAPRNDAQWLALSPEFPRWSNNGR